MKKIFCLLVVVSTAITAYTQIANTGVQKALRVNFLSPGIELEYPLSVKSTLAANAGIDIQGSYLHLNEFWGTGITYYIAPFLDLSYKRFYNRERRQSKGKNLAFNSGNYWSVRLLTNFKEIYAHNVYRTDDISFALGPTWGLQRAYGKVHFLFDVGPVYYFDTKGNNGFFPLMIQLNFGYNFLMKRK